MPRCVHCGGPDARPRDLVFETGGANRELTLALCPQCLDAFLDDPAVGRV